MNLSLYLLLTQPIDSKTSVRAIRPAQRKTHQHPAVMPDPVRAGTARASAPLQASRCRASSATRHSLGAGKLGFAARVVCNAMGILLMFSGLLVLLQIAQLSLS